MINWIHCFLGGKGGSPWLGSIMEECRLPHGDQEVDKEGTENKTAPARAHLQGTTLPIRPISSFRLLPIILSYFKSSKDESIHYNRALMT